MTGQQLEQLSIYVRSKVCSLFESSIFSDPPGWYESMSFPHKGFFIGVFGPSGEEIARVGFLKDGLTNVSESSYIVTKDLFNELKSKNFFVEDVKKSTFHFVIVQDCIYLPDPMLWNENKDGIYFMWGQKYRGFYLPYQVRQMNMSKIDVMDRLCAYECKVPSSLWRLAEGLCWKLVCISHVS